MNLQFWERALQIGQEEGQRCGGAAGVVAEVNSIIIVSCL